MTTEATTPHLSEDSGIVLALAGTAVPFAASAEEEAERWLRVMRLHGEVGCALQSLGVPPAPLETTARPSSKRQWRLRTLGGDAVEIVTAGATERCRARDASLIRTSDLLAAVIDLYGEAFDAALAGRGTCRDELLERLHRPLVSASEPTRAAAYAPPAASWPIAANGAG